jgi:hypothetical protein
LDTDDNNIRFSQKMDSVHAEEKAKKFGAVKGDTLLVCGSEFVVDN